MSRHIGDSFDNFLDDQGYLDDVNKVAIGRTAKFLLEVYILTLNNSDKNENYGTEQELFNDVPNDFYAWYIKEYELEHDDIDYHFVSYGECIGLDHNYVNVQTKTGGDRPFRFRHDHIIGEYENGTSGRILQHPETLEIYFRGN